MLKETQITEADLAARDSGSVPTGFALYTALIAAARSAGMDGPWPIHAAYLPAERAWRLWQVVPNAPTPATGPDVSTIGAAFDSAMRQLDQEVAGFLGLGPEACSVAWVNTWDDDVSNQHAQMKDILAKIKASAASAPPVRINITDLFSAN